MIYSIERISITCNFDGRIQKVHFKNLNDGSGDIDGKLFIDLFSPEFTSSALDFLVEVKKSSASFGWELRLKSAYAAEPFSFAGAVIGDGILIFGSVCKIDFSNFLSGMMRLNSEQKIKIRLFEKEQTKQSAPEIIENIDLLNELSRLNNELINMQRELAKKNGELNELNNLKNRFIGIAAHDLINPLSQVIICSEFIENEIEKLSDEQVKFITYIKTLSRFMLNMVKDTLDVATIESGKIDLRYEQVDLVSLIEQNVQLNRIIADKKQVRVNYKSNVEFLLLYLDRGKIEQVINNLFINAVKFSKEQTQINIDLLVSGSDVIVSVKDQGQGIKEDELKLLFKPFQKTGTKPTDGEKSTGLGLYIVKRIIEAHQGKLWVNSEPERGSSFYFSLPIEIKL